MRFRIATFNVENLDDVPGKKPTLDERITILRPQLKRLNANIICFQEVHGQERTNKPREVLALKKLIENTAYSNFYIESTKTSDANEVYDKRNLVVVSEFEILESKQIKHELIPAPKYEKVTEQPRTGEAKTMSWERPIFYTKIKVRDDFIIHLVNLHLKSKRPVDIDGQKKDRYSWKTSYGWAEGFFISSMKRVGQALETRLLVDQIFDTESNAKIIISGDFNAHPTEVPVEAITGRIENTDNPDLSSRVLFPCENTIPESSRYSYIHRGDGKLLDHMLISLSLLPYYRHAEIHNETLHDESIAFATDVKFPESDHAPFVTEFEI
jgi:exonuclease III